MNYLILVVLGAVWGSFANVCIYRIPLGKEIVIKRSFCPNCKSKISWFDNIPIFSYIFLLGKCRNCKSSINFQYLIVEVLGIISFLFIFLNFGLSLTSLLLMILIISFVIIFFIDLKNFIIPDILTFPLMIIGFIKSFDPNLNTSIFPNFINSAIGGIFGYLIIYTVIYFYKTFRKKEGMGLGDAKLMAVIGFWFGWASIPFVLFIGSIVALLITLPSLILSSKRMSSEIPFGPYLITATVIYFFFADFLKNILTIY